MGRFASVILAYVGVATFALVSLVIGVRLLLLWRQTRKLPELLIGLSFLFEAVLTNVLNLLEKLSSRLPDALHGPIHVGVVVSGTGSDGTLGIAASEGPSGTVTQAVRPRATRAAESFSRRGMVGLSGVVKVTQGQFVGCGGTRRQPPGHSFTYG